MSKQNRISILIAAFLMLSAFAPVSYPVAASQGPASLSTINTAQQATALPALSDESPQSIPLPPSATPIRFPLGAVSYVVATDLTTNQPVAYRLYAAAGQNLNIETNGSPYLQVYAPDQSQLTGVLQTPGPMRVHLTQTGYQTIVLLGSGRAVLSVYIPALRSLQDRPAPLPSYIPTLHFASGADSAEFNLQMNPAVPVAYRLWAQAGQQLAVNLQGDATAAVMTSSEAALTASTPASGKWQFNLPASANYTLVLLGTGAVNVQVVIPPAGSPLPTPVPLPATTTRVSFALGNASTTVNTTLVAGKPQGYVLRVLRGQTLYVSTTINTSVSFYGPGNVALPVTHPANTYRWSTAITQTGDYVVVFSGAGATTLTFYVPPL